MMFMLAIVYIILLWCSLDWVDSESRKLQWNTKYNDQAIQEPKHTSWVTTSSQTPRFFTAVQDDRYPLNGDISRFSITVQVDIIVHLGTCYIQMLQLSVSLVQRR
jgi:hypothetical protein